MKKLTIIFFTIIFVLLPYQISFVTATSEKPNLVSEAAILIDNKTEKILYQKNAGEKKYPASTTKIVTAILALEHCQLNDIVTVSYDAATSIPDGYSSASLQVGEQLTIEQLLQLLLIHSANDAANVLAEYVGGSIESFISMMNTKMNELGLQNTHFTNAFGMHDDNHYTTAQDLAKIMQYCLKNENFRKLAGSSVCVLPATNEYGPRKYTSTNELIVPNNNNYYRYLTAGKTGYTSQAGDCLVSCAYKNDLELICVILGGKTVNGVSTRFSETKTLYEYGYNNYGLQTLLNENDKVTEIEVQNGTKETRQLDLLTNTSLKALLQNTFDKNTLSAEINLPDTIKAPISQGDIIGSVSYNIDGIVYETSLVASHSVEESKILSLILKIGLIFLILLVFYTIFFNKKRKKKKRKKSYGY